jgi:hypothetical protein
METAKVDIRKLQLLNDRINQCIEALSQVRLSVHGLSHTAGPQPGMGVGWTPGFGFAASGIGYPQAGVGFPQAGIGYPQAGVPSPFGQGLSHTAGVGPVGIGPFGGFPPGISAGLSPQQSWPTPFIGLGGLSHSSSDVTTDPFLVARIAQTFPYVQFLTPPVVAY